MLVVLTVAAVMMGLGVTTIHLLLGSEHEAMKAARYAASLSRLARIFREDVHAATKVEIAAVDAGQASVLIITADGQRAVRYEAGAHVVKRSEAGAGEVTARDVFHFPPHSRIRFSHADKSGPVRLEIGMATGPVIRGKNSQNTDSPTRLVAVEAVPGRERRFEK